MSAINVECDQLVPLGTLLKQRLGKRPSPATQWRWRLHGVGGVRLECVLVGGVWYTTAAAFAEFVRVQTANCSPTPMDSDAPAERSDVKKRKLAVAGLL